MRKALVVLALTFIGLSPLSAQNTAAVVPIFLYGAESTTLLSALHPSVPREEDLPGVRYLVSAPVLSGFAELPVHVPIDEITVDFLNKRVQMHVRADGDSMNYQIDDQAGGVHIAVSYDGSTRKLQYHETKITTIPPGYPEAPQGYSILTVIDINDADVDPSLSVQCTYSVLSCAALSPDELGIAKFDNIELKTSSHLHGIAYHNYRSYFGPAATTGALAIETAAETAKECLQILQSAETTLVEEANALWFIDEEFNFAGTYRGQSFEQMKTIMPWDTNVE